MGIRARAVFDVNSTSTAGLTAGLVDEVAEGALQLQGFGGAGAGGR